MITARDWRYPRDTIAQVYKDNDYGYIFHGGMLFVEFLRAYNKNMNELRGKKILDYGCGTGRVSRFLALTGAQVYGYDPTPECVAEADNESLKVPPTSLKPVQFTCDFSQVGDEFDIAVCINVLSHLTMENQDLAIRNIVGSLKENGTCFLWVHKNCHLPMIDRDIIRSQTTNTVIVKGVKINGRITQYERC